MVHRHSASARRLRAQRAAERGYLRRRPYDTAFVAVPPPLAMATKAAVRSLRLHAEHDAFNDVPHHHGRLATRATAARIGEEAARRSYGAHRTAGRLKHSIGRIALASMRKVTFGSEVVHEYAVEEGAEFAVALEAALVNDRDGLVRLQTSQLDVLNRVRALEQKLFDVSKGYEDISDRFGKSREKFQGLEECVVTHEDVRNSKLDVLAACERVMGQFAKQMASELAHLAADCQSKCNAIQNNIGMLGARCDSRCQTIQSDIDSLRKGWLQAPPAGTARCSPSRERLEGNRAKPAGRTKTADMGCIEFYAVARHIRAQRPYVPPVGPAPLMLLDLPAARAGAQGTGTHQRRASLDYSKFALPSGVESDEEPVDDDLFSAILRVERELADGSLCTRF